MKFFKKVWIILLFSLILNAASSMFEKHNLSKNKSFSHKKINSVSSEKLTTIRQSPVPINLNLANLSIPSVQSGSNNTPLTTTFKGNKDELKVETTVTTILSLIQNPSFWTVGYNIFKANPKMIPSNGKLLDPGFAADVLKYNQPNQKTGDGLYEYAPGFSVQTTEICQANFSSQTIRTKTELENSVSASLGISGEYLSFAFQMNADYNRMANSLSNQEKVYIMQEAECGVYKVQIKQFDPPELSDNFINGLKSINGKTLENAREAYDAFIESFGTHYLKEIVMGSKFSYVVETTNHQYNQMLKQGVNISAEAKYSAVASVSAKASTKVTSSKTEEFEKNITNKFAYSLGAPMPGNLNIADWFEKSKIQPMPISYSISPITQLLGLSASNEQLKKAGINANELIKNLDHAIKNLTKVHIENVKKQIQTSNQITYHSKLNSYYTDMKDGGPNFGDMNYLDRHEINCQTSEALHSFLLIKGDKNVRFNYQCINSNSINENCYTTNTRPDLKNSVEYLDRHDIACRDNHVLRNFKVVREGDTKLYYNYTCCRMNFTPTCRNVSTSQTTIHHGKEYIYLENQRMTHPENWALARFQLSYDKGNRIHYNLRICDITHPPKNQRRRKLKRFKKLRY